MIKINLLPPEIIAQRKRRASQGRAGRLAVLLAIVLIAAFAVQMLFTLQVKAKIKSVSGTRLVVETDIEKYAPVVELQGRVNNKIER
jgi:Ca2+/H+ antiporter